MIKNAVSYPFEILAAFLILVGKGLIWAGRFIAAQTLGILHANHKGPRK